MHAVGDDGGDRADAAVALPHVHAPDDHHRAVQLHRSCARPAGGREIHPPLFQVCVKSDPVSSLLCLGKGGVMDSIVITQMCILSIFAPGE